MVTVTQLSVPISNEMRCAITLASAWRIFPLSEFVNESRTGLEVRRTDHSMSTLVAATLPGESPMLPADVNKSVWRLVHALTLILVGVLFVATIRHGHHWGDDFALYLKHASNIAEWKPYSDTGYIYNPLNPVVGPKSYPPLFSTVLAPVALVFGLNLVAYKTLLVLLFVVSLALAAKLFSRDMRGRDLWIVLTIVGFSPVSWELKEAIISEHLFTPLWFATLLLLDDWYRRKLSYGNPATHGLILGMLIFLTCCARTVGVVLLPIVVLCEILIAHKLTRVGLVALLTATLLIVSERLLLPSSGAGYLEQLKGISVSQLISNFYYDLNAFKLLWKNDSWWFFSKQVGLILIAFALLGLVHLNLKTVTPLCIAVVAYFALIVAWPSAEGLRMVIPLLPAFLFYVIAGFGSVLSVPRLKVSGPIVLLIYSLCSFASYYSRADFGPITQGVESESARELFEFVRDRTPRGEVTLFFKPRALALFTDHPASAFPTGSSEDEFWRYADSINAGLIIVRDNARLEVLEDKTFEMVGDFSRQKVSEVFHNSQFRVYWWDRERS
ncbi:MAG: hypothetical protein JWM11_7034 [Planctomycetaceae bacterium]|nr:hypothetical protein [Planctomycetaceae bacterium]